MSAHLCRPRMNSQEVHEGLQGTAGGEGRGGIHYNKLSNAKSDELCLSECWARRVLFCSRRVGQGVIMRQAHAHLLFVLEVRHQKIQIVRTYYYKVQLPSARRVDRF